MPSGKYCFMVRDAGRREFHTGRSGRSFWMKARTAVIASEAKQSRSRAFLLWIASLRSQ
jgi:hypothetical protein